MSNQLKRLSQRAAAAFAALAMGTGLTITSLLTPAAVSAVAPVFSGGQAQSRAIYMSNSTPGATGVSYEVTFKPTVATAIKGVILDFCAGSPIIGDSTCGAPSGLSIGTPTVDTSVQTAGTNSPISTNGLPGTWTAAAPAGTTLKLTNASGAGVTAGATYSFIITTMTNPTQATPGTNGTFYARLITYDSNTGDIATYAAGSEGTTNPIDYGGFALSTAYNVQVTAKVQESLTFCTSGISLATNTNCTSATNPQLTLGHGTPAILDNSAVDAASAYTQASTNASTGLVIRMHATNACTNGGLSTNGGTTCNINGQGVSTATGVTAGTTFFGLMVGPSVTTSSVATSTGTITPDLNYNASGSTAISGTAASNAYGMDTTTGSGVTSTFGDQIASSTGPVSQVNNQLLFAATAGLTVPAGIYQGQESIIATGTF